MAARCIFDIPVASLRKLGVPALLAYYSENKERKA